MTGVLRTSVIMPVHRVTRHFGEAVESVLAQTVTAFELLIVVNGSDVETHRAAAAYEERDGRVRVIGRPRANLSAAVNAGAREARSDVLARMDADDWCYRNRLERQLEVLDARPGVGVVGSSFRQIDEEGRVVRTVPTPADPREVRWRLMLGNVVAHGSVMMRRAALERAGWYDEAIERGQDHELWLRMSRVCDIANVPEVLYAHRVRDTSALGPVGDQALTSASAMLDAWRGLPAGSDVVPLIAGALERCDGEASSAAIDRALRESPSIGGLMAWLMAHGQRAWPDEEIYRSARLARVREIARRLASLGVDGVWLWGAGAHTAWLLAEATEAGLRVRGIVDDARVGQRVGGHGVASPDSLGAGETIVLSSDAHERALWAASASARARGVRVFGLYLDVGWHEAGDVPVASAEAGDAFAVGGRCRKPSAGSCSGEGVHDAARSHAT